ncbi:MAG: Uma2 family endonuclease [Armatimonadetes bacterium]|nr:Uma2 family endonuclease [Armatimonadota bacterium]
MTASESALDWTEPDYSKLVTEDDQPVDNMFSERQQKLLGDCLEASYNPGTPFLGVTDVGIFYVEGDPIVPDFLLSLDVSFPEGDPLDKRNRSYYIWRFGKPPDLVVEIVSNRVGGEDTRKLADYQHIKVPYYAIYDPRAQLSKRPLRLYELKGALYVERVDPFTPMEPLGLRFVEWRGTYAQYSGGWLRWCDLEGSLLATGTERAEQAEERAERAEERAERLAARLKELGLDPDEGTP